MEGDIRRNREQLREYIIELGRLDRRPRTGERPELIVNVVKNRIDYLEQKEKRRVRYSIDKKSFSSDEYKEITKIMSSAAKDWGDLCPTCGVSFIHAKKFDSDASTDKTSFVVMKFDSRQQFIASAFFPSDPADDRYLLIDPSFFDDEMSFKKEGVLRHELGHILGYRHEQIRGIPGCDQEGTSWKALTNYDPNSIMHYFCGNGGTKTLEFTNVDRVGHRCLYDRNYRERNRTVCEPSGATEVVGAVSPVLRPPSEAEPLSADLEERTDSGMLVVDFIAGDIPKNLVRVIDILLDQGVIRPHTWKAEPNDTVCVIYRRAMDWPGVLLCPDALLQLAARINNQTFEYMRGLRLKIGQPIKVVPHLDIVSIPLIESNRLPPTKFSGKEINDKQREAIGYRLSMLMPTLQQARKHADAIKGWGNPDIVARGLPREKPKLNFNSANITRSTVKSKEYLTLCTSGNIRRHMQTHYIDILPATGSYELPSCNGKSEVVLLDTSVFPHPNLKGAIASPPMTFRDVVIADEPETCMTVEKPHDRAFHGTMMAGIIAAQRDGHPFVGVASNARIHSKDIQKFSLMQYKDEVLDSLRAGRRIFAMAAGLEKPVGEGENKLNFPDERDRLSVPLNEVVSEQNAVFVTSIGQAQSDESKSAFTKPTEIRKNSNMSPANLGDHASVIVVTACEVCDDAGARLLPDAHYSESDRLVHVAAPGKDVPALANADRVMPKVDGTSPATALVAGVAAQMNSCYPDYYSVLGSLKERIQITARPVLKGADAKRVQGGIIDVALAFKDPYRHWLKRVGQPNYEPVDIKHWCVASMGVVDAKTERPISNGSAAAKHVHRLVRASWLPGDPPQYVIFMKSGISDGGGSQGMLTSGAVSHTPPGKLSESGSPAFRTAAGNIVDFDDIDDLVLSKLIVSKDKCS